MQREKGQNQNDFPKILKNKNTKHSFLNIEVIQNNYFLEIITCTSNGPPNLRGSVAYCRRECN